MASHNLHRRDLDRSQKAILALEFEKLYAEEAAKRKRAGKSDLRADLPEGHDERRPREQAARVVGVSGRGRATLWQICQGV